ncbi:MAG TPA: hypothetical protein VMZ53_11840 [Kofleriaceae bacterium]|nr:hypothetical protein [Kofleriaceae bacterium]
MRLALISAFGLLAAACGGDSSVDISTNQDNFCEQIADVVCHNLYQCCTESEIEDRLSVSEPRTEAQCRQDYSRLCQRGGADVRDSLQDGRITFDPAKLNGCLEAILAPTDTCSAVAEATVPWKEACKDAPWVGTVAVGAACLFPFDCAGAPDAFCGPDLKCKMKPTAGFPCSTSNPCASAYYCQPTTSTCAPKVAAGAACTSSTQCGTDLFCDNKNTIDPADDVCAPKGAGGAACHQAASSQFTSQALANAACISGTCNPGKCSGTSQNCYSDLNCGGRCSLSPTTSCVNSYPDCNPSGGQCTGNGQTCTSDATCIAASAGTCFFTQSCVPSQCVGDVVCTSTTITADYCTAVGSIPSP